MIFHQPHNSQGNYSYNLSRYEDVHWEFHFHRNFELIYVESGRVQCTVASGTQILEPGDFGLVLSNEIHAYHTHGPSVCHVLVFSGDFVHAFERQCEGKVGDGFRFRCPRETVDYLNAVLFSQQAHSIFLLKACCYLICDCYLNAVTLSEQKGKSGQLMAELTRFIQENHRENITLSDAARELGYDYWYLSKRFRRIFNMSFSDYLNSYRLETAIALLTETDHRVGDIALESGFQSIRSFNHFFKSRTGMNPGAFRQFNR